MPTTAPNIVRAAYAELVVTDLERARWFWVDMLGFVLTAGDDHALYLRGYEETTHHSLVLREGPAPAAACLAYRVWAAEDLDLAERWYAERGCTVERRPEWALRGIGEAVRVEDPLGFTLEFFQATDRTERLLQRFELYRGASIARIDHFNICVDDPAAAYDYYDALGFRCSETIEDDQRLYAAWMYRKPSVHDVAFTGGASPRLHHVGFFTPEAHHILRLCDLFGAINEQDHIERGPGRHGVSNAFYVYLRDPDGHRIEIYTSDYFTGDPDHETYRWDVSDVRRRDFWGAAVVPSWYAEAMPILDLRGAVVPVREPETEDTEVKVGADGYR
ncbi:MAG TPA: 3,4-dihydroxyphenylacetate 2,3-dioxygenase [Acidimicrobiales bacterium]|nr:3,4-dihydroxyphenylacetate 2,3-dioxygenase [Acidimicrobiales bacterium]